MPPTPPISRVHAVAPRLHTFDIVTRAHARRARGLPVHNLAAGQPYAATPALIREAAATALARADLGYSESTGMIELRERIAQAATAQAGVPVDPAEVVVTGGSTQAFQFAVLAAFRPGDRVGVARPGYAAYESLLALLGCEVVPLPTTQASGWQPTPDLLDAAGPLAGVLLADPATPVGVGFDDAALAALVAHCRVRGIRIVSDEVYHGVRFAGRDRTLRSLDPAALVLGSFSKRWAMTGWRLGWLLVPADLRRDVADLAAAMAISPSALAQHAALAAFDPRVDEEVRGLAETYRPGRDRMLAELPALGIPVAGPHVGSFYVWADVSRFTADSARFAYALLDEAGVAVVPGEEFDPERGHRWIRLSFSAHPDEVSAGMDALRRALTAPSDVLLQV